MTGFVARRVAARFVDLFTVFFLTFGLAVSVLFPVMGPLTELLDIGPWGTNLAPTLVMVLVGAIYETTFVSIRGQTPGRDLLNLRVVSGTAAGPPTRIRAAMRALCWLLLLVPDPVAVVLIAGASVLWLWIDPVHRGPHDRLVGTVVISYDADVEEGPVSEPQTVRDIDGAYGPRSWRSLAGVPKS